MDAFLDILRSMRLTGGIFLDAEFTAPWCVSSQVAPEDCRPYVPEPRNIIAYHYVSEGRLLLLVEGQPPVTVGRGEIVVLPRNDGHQLASALGLLPVRADDLIQPSLDGGLARIVHGGGGECTRIICGFLGCDTPNDPILGILPAVLRLDVAEGASGSWIESSFRFAAQEMGRGGAASPAVLAKLAELLFLEAVRRYLASLRGDGEGWLAGMRDPVVGRALALMHARLAERWTTEKLAREAGLSRSAFAAHFTCLMGEPPMHYLARRRMQFASQRLKETRASVAQIAFDVGYDSEAAFNRAFKREFAMPPAAWRRYNLARPEG
jgi:AraC-like DNA-binding protein